VIVAALIVVALAAVISNGVAHQPDPLPGACDTGGVWMGDCSDP